MSVKVKRETNMSVKVKRDIKIDKSMTATGIVIIMMVALLVGAYIGIDISLRNRAIERMHENVRIIAEEVKVKIRHDSEILNASAEMLSQLEKFDNETASQVMRTNNSLIETMQIRIFLPDNTVLLPDGNTYAVTKEQLSFEEEAALGEHLSNKTENIATGTPILRYYVPIVREETTVALLYGITELEDLSDSLNNELIYGGSASIYIIDTRNGDFILDTYPAHQNRELENIRDYDSSVYPRKIKGNRSWEEYTDKVLALETGYVIFRTELTDGWDYMFYGPMQINDWAIAIEVPEKVAFASLFTVRLICFILGVLMAGVIIAYYFWVRNNSKKTTERAVEQAVLAEKLRKAEAADKAKSAFLFNMSHDIRTPMNAIIGYTTLVKTCLNDRKKSEEYIDKILSSGTYMLSLVNDVLDMSYIESGKLNIEEKNCSLSEIFGDMRNIVMPQMRSKRLNFYMDAIDVIDEDIRCDKLHVDQALLKLLSNAIKFTPSGGTVWLTVAQKPDAPDGYGDYEIRVKDTGIGMSKEFIEHIFEPFERERNTTASGIHGTGLGMSITKNIIDAMGGTITVDSEKDKGTEFVINLRFRLQTEAKKPEYGELKGLRALIVDDSGVTCDSVSAMLGRMGICADSVFNGNEAVIKAKQARDEGKDYNVFIINRFLPDSNGLEVTSRIREIVGSSAIVIMISVYDETDLDADAETLGVTAFCGKPVFSSVLGGILLSATEKNISSEHKEEESDEARVVEGKRLLLTEDNELNREIAEELLSEKGFIVDSAEDGSVAVEKVKNSPHGYYSLILMDIQMPVMNGYEATRAIRALDDKVLASIPIVAMTANAFDEDKRQAFESGMNAHVAKPFDIDKLTELIIGILEQNAKDDDSSR